jgi:hypothetical protein
MRARDIEAARGGPQKPQLPRELRTAVTDHEVQAKPEPLAPRQAPFVRLRYQLTGFFARQHRH